MPSFVEENYLKAKYRLCQAHQSAVSTHAIADSMKTKPAFYGAMQIALEDRQSLFLSREVANSLLVTE